MHFTKVFFVALSLCLPAVVSAQNVVVELFTSQGCSSCPPADALIQKLASEENVIVLGWHVDYWDYLGWKDEFSRPENTKRQMGYRDRWNLRSLYTPQAVIHGEAQIVGSDERKVRMYVEQFQTIKPLLDLELAIADDFVEIRLSARTSGLPAADVFLVKIIPETSSAIPRGENAGRTIEYVNVVVDMKWLASWNGRTSLTKRVQLDSDSKYVVLVQGKNFGPILGAEYLN